MPERSELVFGLVGPVGCPIHEAGEVLEAALKRIYYCPVSISLSTEMDRLLAAKEEPLPTDGRSALENKIKKGNSVRKAFKNNSVLAAEAIRQIVMFRATHARNSGETDEDKIADLASIPLSEHAFIIRQLKRPEEVDLLVKAFGKNFVQVSVVTSLDSKKQTITNRLGTEQHGWSPQECSDHAEEPIRTDQDEKLGEHGQKISKIFHRGDVFLTGNTEQDLETSCRRFIEAFFGRNSIAPTRDEFGSYMAKAASLRSVDLSRQVGSAITNSNGDLIAVGCNEVPKFGGGNYWDEDELKRRDIDLGGEANKGEVNRIVFDFIDVLRKQGLIGDGNTAKSILANDEHRKAIKKSLVGGVTEYGRMVHAEMNALSDATRLGRSVRGATIYVTTYPCHNCAKHLIAAGIERIVFVEPYPKSKAENLFEEILSPDSHKTSAVSIEHFNGISPSR